MFFHEAEATLHLLTMGTWAVFPPFTSFPPDSRHPCLQQLLLGLTCRHGLTCRVRGYQSITCLREMSFITVRSSDAAFFTVACVTSCGTPYHACSHSCPLESGHLMETAVNLQLLLIPYPLLSLKLWLFQTTTIPLQLGLLPLTTELQ